MAIFGGSAISFLYQIEIRQERIRKDYLERDRTLEKLRSSIYLSGTYARDFLLDTNDTLAQFHRDHFLQVMAEVNRAMDDYARLVRADEREPFQQLKAELSLYLSRLTPALDWDAAKRSSGGVSFVQNEVLPRRMLAIGLADRIQAVSEKELEASSQQLSEMFSSFRTKLIFLLLLIAAIGCALAGVTMWRLFQLERTSEMRFQEVLSAREELKQLSGEVVAAQENERRRISRELHDEVGQVLSATMLALGNLRSSLKENNVDEASRQLQMSEEMTERSARVVRNISLLLRPSMLDDLGLIPALKWLAREVSRTDQLPVEVIADDFPESLPDEHRTCIYRVVQESLRNAARHAGAHQARISVQQEDGNLHVAVRDDGKGFDPSGESGMGLLGMEERVVRLRGKFRIDSEKGLGTTVDVVLPLPETIPHDTNPFRTA